jgi:hypothetical protein
VIVIDASTQIRGSIVVVFPPVTRKTRVQFPAAECFCCCQEVANAIAHCPVVVYATMLRDVRYARDGGRVQAGAGADAGDRAGRRAIEMMGARKWASGPARAAAARPLSKFPRTRARRQLWSGAGLRALALPRGPRGAAGQACYSQNKGRGGSGGGRRRPNFHRWRRILICASACSAEKRAPAIAAGAGAGEQGQTS